VNRYGFEFAVPDTPVVAKYFANSTGLDKIVRKAVEGGNFGRPVSAVIWIIAGTFSI
jgi:hypothetical protein